jgi:hypothetical protein
MAVVNVACPYCGKETLATVPSSEYGVTAVKKNHNQLANDSNAGCNECGEVFGYQHFKK